MSRDLILCKNHSLIPYAYTYPIHQTFCYVVWGSRGASSRVQDLNPPPPHQILFLWMFFHIFLHYCFELSPWTNGNYPIGYWRNTINDSVRRQYNASPFRVIVFEVNPKPIRLDPYEGRTSEYVRHYAVANKCSHQSPRNCLPNNLRCSLTQLFFSETQNE